MKNPVATWNRKAARDQRMLRLTHVVATACALLLLWLVDYSYQRLIDINSARNEAAAARASIDDIMNLLVTAESSQRGYLVTDDQQYLDNYVRAAQSLQTEANRIDASLVASFGSSKQLAQFRALLAQRLDGMSTTIQLHAEGKIDPAAFAAAVDVGRQQTNDFLAHGKQLVAGADRIIALRQAEYDRLIKVSRLAFFACVLAVLLGFVRYVQQRHRMRIAEMHQRHALEVARDTLESQVRERTRDLSELASYLQRVVETERARLARELHDELGALMTAAKLDLARLKSRLPDRSAEVDARLQHLNQMIGEAVALKRRIMDSLHPSALNNLGLVVALEILAREFGQTAGLTVQTSLEPVEPDADTTLTIYRTVQEALTNIARYAKASRVAIALHCRGEQLEVSVCDDGIGFDPTRISRSSHGLAGMRHRLLASGGQLHIDSALGRGTRVIATLPLLPERVDAHPPAIVDAARAAPAPAPTP